MARQPCVCRGFCAMSYTTFFPGRSPPTRTRLVLPDRLWDSPMVSSCARMSGWSGGLRKWPLLCISFGDICCIVSKHGRKSSPANWKLGGGNLSRFQSFVRRTHIPWFASGSHGLISWRWEVGQRPGYGLRDGYIVKTLSKFCTFFCQLARFASSTRISLLSCTHVLRP